MMDAQVSQVEEVVLELMEQAEDARTTEARLHGEFDAAKRKWQEVMAHTQAETARLQQEIAVLRPQREQHRGAVEKPMFRRYDEIRQRHEGIGLAVTASDICPACHMKLTPQSGTLARRRRFDLLRELRPHPVFDSES